jgi:hypothetical protein
VTPEIRAFEFAVGVFSVLIGLAIADIATSFQRLLGSEIRIKWDPLALMAAAYALCMAIYMWFDLWGVRNFAAARQFLFYICLFSELFVLYLIAASSLPADGISHDLRDFYSKNQRRFWLLVMLFQVGYVLAGFYFISGEIVRLSGPVFARGLIQMIAPLVLAMILYWTTSRLVHYIGIGLLFVVMLIHYGSASIN